MTSSLPSRFSVSGFLLWSRLLPRVAFLLLCLPGILCCAAREKPAELNIVLKGKAQELPAVLRATNTLSPASRERHTKEVEDFIQSLNEAEFQSVLDSLPAMYYDFDVYYPALSVARRMSAKDPHAALEYFHKTWEDLNQQFDAYAIALEAWHRKDPAGLEPYVFEALRNWGPSEQRMAEYMSAVIARKHLPDGIDRTVKWLEAIPDIRARAKSAEGVMLELHGDFRLEDFAPWVAANSTKPEFKDAAIKMAAALSAVNPVRGYEWAFGLPNSPAKYHAICSQFESIGGGHPMMGVAWFNSPLESKASSLGALIGLKNAPPKILARNSEPDRTAWTESYLVEDLVAAYVTGILRISDHGKVFFMISQVTDPVFKPLVRQEYIRQLRRQDMAIASAEAAQLGVPLK